jgi:hypothetical protein
MFGLRVLLITTLLAFTFACSRGLPPPEESARAIMRGLITRDFSLLAERFSGAPLRALLASGPGQNFENFCRRLLPVMPPPASWTVRFARAKYQDDGSQVVLHLCLIHGEGEGRKLFETTWRMQYIIHGGWKLVAY